MDRLPAEDGCWNDLGWNDLGLVDVVGAQFRGFVKRQLDGILGENCLEVNGERVGLVDRCVRVASADRIHQVVTWAGAVVKQRGCAAEMGWRICSLSSCVVAQRLRIQAAQRERRKRPHHCWRRTAFAPAD